MREVLNTKKGEEQTREIQALRADMTARHAYGTTVHEFGHWLDNRLPSGEQATTIRYPAGRPDIPIETWEGYHSARAPSFGVGAFAASMYATTNSNEKFAETFTTWWLYSRSKTIQGATLRDTGLSSGLYELVPTGRPIAEESEAIRRDLLTSPSGAQLLKAEQVAAIEDGPFPFFHPVTQFALKPLADDLRKRMLKRRDVFFGDVVRVRSEMWGRRKLVGPADGPETQPQ
jgi:hypothetical protein